MYLNRIRFATLNSLTWWKQNTPEFSSENRSKEHNKYITLSFSITVYYEGETINRDTSWYKLRIPSTRNIFQSHEKFRANWVEKSLFSWLRIADNTFAGPVIVFTVIPCVSTEFRTTQTSVNFVDRIWSACKIYLYKFALASPECFLYFAINVIASSTSEITRTRLTDLNSCPLNIHTHHSIST